MDAKLKILKTEQADIFQRYSQLMAAFAAPVRVRLLHFLAQAPLTVEVLAEKIEQSTANTSMHLRKMLAEGLVSVEVMGQRRLYTLDTAVLAFWEKWQDFAEKLDPSLKLSVKETYGEIQWGEDLKMTLKLVREGKVVLLDVRPAEESGDTSLEHLGVLSIPQSQLKDRWKELPKKKKILVFCRGRLCALSAYSVNYLRQLGLDAYRLDLSWYQLQINKVRE
jgi:DNA-binding transcriptional ArsR family regulator